MTKEYVLSRLCVYDKRNPDYIPYDEENELEKPKDCSCDNCFYGRTILSEKILQLNQAIEDNKDKKYTEEDMMEAMLKICEYYADSVDSGGVLDGYKTANQIIQSLQPKTEWEVEFDSNGKLKLV